MKKGWKEDWQERLAIAGITFVSGTAFTGIAGCALFLWSLPIIFILVVMACLLRLAGFI